MTTEKERNAWLQEMRGSSVGVTVQMLPFNRLSNALIVCRVTGPSRQASIFACLLDTI